ncbi:hypothetical protein X975_01318, partial [Stegodyphus mimosarum]
MNVFHPFDFSAFIYLTSKYMSVDEQSIDLNSNFFKEARMREILLCRKVVFENERSARTMKQQKVSEKFKLEK